MNNNLISHTSRYSSLENICEGFLLHRTPINCLKEFVSPHGCSYLAKKNVLPLRASQRLAKSPVDIKFRPTWMGEKVEKEIN
jgi:hypothetical protein